ncbi:MAG: class I tRNA ligase family protein, partial [Thermaurantiacus sp.]
EAERVAPGEMPDLERHILSRLAVLDAELDQHLEDHGYSRYMQAILDFTVRDLSAFLFDIRKDSLYCDAPQSLRRRSYRTLLSFLFDWLATRLAPVLVFTAEEAWENRGHEGSVHHQTFARADPAWQDLALDKRFERLRELRGLVTAAIEPLRRDKAIGSSLEADVTLETDAETAASLEPEAFAELCIVASVEVQAGSGEDRVMVAPSMHSRCARCWRHLPDVASDTGLCTRCAGVVATLPAEAA